MDNQQNKITVRQNPDVSLQPLPVAVIDIGTTAVRLLIAQEDANHNLHTLESLSLPVSLGTDTFTSGNLGMDAIEEGVQALAKFRHVLDEYRISDKKQLRVVATSGVREARNRYVFVDRVKIATGLDVEVVDEAEVNRLTYLGMQPLFEQYEDLQGVQSLIVEVGGGSTEVLAVRDSDLIFSQSYRLGSLRLREMLTSFRAPLPRQRKVIESHIRQTVREVEERAKNWDSLRLIGMGGDLRFAVDQTLVEADWHGLQRLSTRKLSEFTTKILDQSVDELVNTYHLAYPEAETLGPALLSYLRFVESLGLKELFVASTSMRDGVLNEMVSEKIWSGHFAEQVLDSAMNLGRKYYFDESHCQHVAALSLTLFDELQEEHRLTPRHRLILQVAALLHDIGTYISERSHHKHSMYLIRNSTLFGIGRSEQIMISLIARYHRKALPKPRHEGYNELDQDNRIAMLKLAAILRVADALDRGHARRVGNIRVAKEAGRITVLVPRVPDLTLEQLALREKGELFTQVYGMDIAFRQAPGRR
ncbi:MAG: Ppx/GppA phosphatase family protein [Lentisphaeria bacterium]